MSPDFHLDTAFAKGLRQLFVQVEDRLALKRPVTAYLAGGMAVHLYTGKRVTKDADVEFSARVLVPNDLAVRVQDDGLVTSSEIDVRGREALEGYIGNVSAVSLNLRDAVAMARKIEQAAGASS